MEEEIGAHSRPVVFVMAPPLLATRALQIAEVTRRSLHVFQIVVVSFVF